MTVHLHIGTPKTATSTIQAFFSANRPALAALGWCYPASLGARNHTRLAVAASDAENPWAKRMVHTKAASDVHAARDPIRAELLAETAGAHHVILSNEHTWEQLHTAEELTRLRDLVGDIDPDIRLYCYVRRQDQAFVSRYTTQTIRRSRPPFDPDHVPEPEPWLNYADLLDLWASVFGRDSLTVRIFRPALWTGGDIVTDLCTAMGVPEHERLVRPPEGCQHLARRGDPGVRPAGQPLAAAVQGLSTEPRSSRTHRRAPRAVRWPEAAVLRCCCARLRRPVRPAERSGCRALPRVSA